MNLTQGYIVILTLRLVDFFHKFNKSNAQLICAVRGFPCLTKRDIQKRSNLVL